ncbi:MAG: hypothetical protein NT001_03285 [Candidatus Woesearchaeota archaeon]|nr:hypothetical protein [Candidatus Woesearchaeota archaeon]
MSILRFTREERKRRRREAAYGWGSTKNMTTHEFIAHRERMAMDEKKRKQEAAERARAGGAAGKTPAAAGTGARKGGFLKLLLFLAVIAGIVYLYLKYIKK